MHRKAEILSRLDELLTAEPPVQDSPSEVWGDELLPGLQLRAGGSYDDLTPSTLLRVNRGDRWAARDEEEGFGLEDPEAWLLSEEMERAGHRLH